MKRDLDPAQLRDGAIFDLRLAKFTAARDAIIAGEQAEAEFACTALADILVGTQPFRDLVRTALSGGAEVAGREFTRLLVESMQASAEAEAERELVAAERAAADSPENYRPRTRHQAQLLEKLQS